MKLNLLLIILFVCYPIFSHGEIKKDEEVIFFPSYAFEKGNIYKFRVCSIYIREVETVKNNSKRFKRLFKNIAPVKIVIFKNAEKLVIN